MKLEFLLHTVLDEDEVCVPAGDARVTATTVLEA